MLGLCLPAGGVEWGVDYDLPTSEADDREREREANGHLEAQAAAARKRQQHGPLIAGRGKQATPDKMTGVLSRSLRLADQKGLRSLAAREHTDKDTDIYIYI